MVILRNSTIEIRDARDVARVFQDLLKLEDRIDQDKEQFYVMHVNARQLYKLACWHPIRSTVLRMPRKAGAGLTGCRS